jgi:hypothetical protein
VITAAVNHRCLAGDWREKRGTISFPAVDQLAVAFAVDEFYSLARVVEAREVEDCIADKSGELKPETG